MGPPAGVRYFRVVDSMSTSLSKRLFAGLAAASLGLAVTACGGSEKTESADSAPAAEFDDTVKVGILHSLTGTMAISESTLVDTEKMAIDDVKKKEKITHKQKKKGKNERRKAKYKPNKTQAR